MRDGGAAPEPRLKVIARVETDFPEKFGIPRQSGLVPEARGTIVFEPEYRSRDALKGLEGFDYLWLLWKFEVPEREGFAATVKPPRLGGNTHMGVFATRSPFRPNPIGLSSVKIEEIRPQTERGPLLLVSGVDLRNGTPVYDIKPYLPFADSHPEARGGFADEKKDYRLHVEFPGELLEVFSPERQRAVLELLAQDPRPSYQNDPERRYGVAFAGYNVRFCVDGLRLRVFAVEKLPERNGRHL